MMPVSYAEVCESYDAKMGFCSVAEDESPPYGKRGFHSDEEESLIGTAEELYGGILESLVDRYLKDRYTICVQIKHNEQTVYSLPRIACPRLIIEQLKLDPRKK
jgi:hypothetical protein